MELKVDLDKCTGCGTCVFACPFGAIEVVDGKAKVYDSCVDCGACVEQCPEGALFIGVRVAGEARVQDYRNVWVFAEQRDGVLTRVSHQLMGKARQLADTLGVQAHAVLLGHNVEPLTKELIADGADVVYLVDDPLLEHYRTDLYTKVLSDLIQSKKPEVVLFGATTVGRDLAPRVLPTCGLARSSTLLAASAALVALSVTVFPNFAAERERSFRRSAPRFGASSSAMVAPTAAPATKPAANTQMLRSVVRFM